MRIVKKVVTPPIASAETLTPSPPEGGEGWGEGVIS